MFGAAKLMAEICERMKQPGIIGEILAGVILGPSLLNWVQPNQVIAALAEMGAMFLLFRVGLEVKASELFRLGRTALLVALLGVVFPFLVGVVIFRLHGYDVAASLFVGAAMVATSVGITAQVLASRGLLAKPASRVILAAAVIDDVLGLIVLTFVSSFAAQRVNILGLVFTAGLAAGFTFVIARFGTGALKRIVPALERKLSLNDAQFHIALVILFGLALLAVDVGVAAIVGAFLAGLALSETANRRVHDLAHGVVELLVPFFLGNVGLQLNVRDLGNRETIVLSIVVLFAAVATKLIGCGLGAMPLGRADAMRVAVGMIPRGEVGIVVAQIGLGMGIIQSPVYATIVVMTIGTTLLAPPLLKSAFQNLRPDFTREQFSIG